MDNAEIVPGTEVGCVGRCGNTRDVRIVTRMKFRALVRQAGAILPKRQSSTVSCCSEWCSGLLLCEPLPRWRSVNDSCHPVHCRDGIGEGQLEKAAHGINDAGNDGSRLKSP